MFINKYSKRKHSSPVPCRTAPLHWQQTQRPTRLGSANCSFAKLNPRRSRTVECWATRRSYMRSTRTTFVRMPSISTWRTSKCFTKNICILISPNSKRYVFFLFLFQQEDRRDLEIEEGQDLCRADCLMDGSGGRHGSVFAFVALHGRIREYRPGEDGSVERSGKLYICLI